MHRHRPQHQSIGDNLRLARLEHRAGRLETVLGLLRNRSRNRAHHAPHLLHQAIDGFERELAAVRRELGHRRHT
jgi:hypothetical protein